MTETQIPSSLKHVMSPFRIGNIAVKNRVVRPAHGTMFSDGTITDQLIDYHVERANGGVGLTVLEGAWVHHSSAGWGATIHCWDDGIIPSFQKLMRAVEPSGMKVFQQLWHGGGTYSHWAVVPKGPSALPAKYSGVQTRALSEEEIQDLVRAFAAAARRCEQGGLHGVELAGAHGYLVMQFLSSWSNRRTDKYGGTLENRARFARELMAAMRAAVSDDFAVGIRLGDEVLDGGLQIDEIVETLQLLKSDGSIDFVNLSLGAYHNPEVMIPALHQPSGFEMKWNSGVRQQVGIATIVNGRFRSLDEANQVIADGDADLVGMTRAHIADPHVVRKTLESGPDSVRPCIGCNQLCVGNIFIGAPLQCTINAQVGRETQFPGGSVPKTAAPKKVMVVGGGPAGMEAARVAALAGHSVSLHEAMPDLGGQIRLTREVPRLAGLADVIVWQEAELYRLGVSINYGSYVEASDVLAEQPDVVILATGSFHRDDGWQLGAPAVRLNFSPPRAIDVTDLLEGRATVDPGKTVVVIDDTGHFEATGVAEFLLSKGAKVEMVTRFGDLAPQMSTPWRSRPALQRMNATGRFRLHTHAYVSEVATQGPVTVASFVDAPSVTVDADHVILVGFNIANDSLLEELESQGFKGEVKLAGDCNSPRYLHAAFHDAFNVASSL